jgi:hypothetical protein
MNSSYEQTTIDVLALLRSHRLSCGSEAELQVAIMDLLEQHGVEFQREHRLNRADRIDFFLADGNGIEVKIDGSAPALIRQLHRYAQHDSIQGLIVVTSRARLTQMPSEINGKPIEVVSLMEGVL